MGTYYFEILVNLTEVGINENIIELVCYTGNFGPSHQDNQRNIIIKNIHMYIYVHSDEIIHHLALCPLLSLKIIFSFYIIYLL